MVYIYGPVWSSWSDLVSERLVVMTQQFPSSVITLNISAQSPASQPGGGGRGSWEVWIVATQSQPNYNESYKPTV